MEREGNRDPRASRSCAVTPKLGDWLQQFPEILSEISVHKSIVLGTAKTLCRTLKRWVREEELKTTHRCQWGIFKYIPREAWFHYEFITGLLKM